MKKDIEKMLANMKRKEAAREKPDANILAVGLLMFLVAELLVVDPAGRLHTGEAFSDMILKYLILTFGSTALMFIPHALLHKTAKKERRLCRFLLKAVEHTALGLFMLAYLPVLIVLEILKRLHFSVNTDNLDRYLFSSGIFITVSSIGILFASILSESEVLMTGMLADDTGISARNLVIILTYVLSVLLARFSVWLPYRRKKIDPDTYRKTVKDLAILRCSVIALLYIASYLLYIPDSSTSLVFEEMCETYEVMAVVSEVIKTYAEKKEMMQDEKSEGKAYKRKKDRRSR